MIEQHELY